MKTTLCSIDVLTPAAREAEERIIWRSALGTPVQLAQPLTGWIMATLARSGYKRALSAHLAGQLGVHHQTWQAGFPRRNARHLHAWTQLGKSVTKAFQQSHPEIAARRIRALDRLGELRADGSRARFVFFHGSIGSIGDDVLERLAVELDVLSGDVLAERCQANEIAGRVVAAAERAETVASGNVPLSTDLDPALDATLLLFARLDVDLAGRLMVHANEITSLFCPLISMSGAPSRRTVRRRLLDIFYSIAHVASGHAFPQRPASVREMEDMLLGGPPAAGTQSFIVRWSGGTTKRLRMSDVIEMAAEVKRTTGVEVEGHFRTLYLAALLFELIEATGPRSLWRTGRRYREWWDAQVTPGRSKVAADEPFWIHFEPYA